jgi:TIR domain-containing protein/pentapeptide repeat protein
VANETHLKRLRRGVAAWNAWWDRQPKDLIVDLSGADLRSTSLVGAQLAHADLEGANLANSNLANAELYGVDLSHADLRGARLELVNLNDSILADADLSDTYLVGARMLGAYLYRANLSRADLSLTNLSHAELMDANLSQAILAGTILYDADLSGAIVEDAYLSGTIFGDTVLSKVSGLERCRHRGPSVIDFQTLQNSGPIPIQFLRDIGLPDNLIDYLPSLLSQAIQFYSCFISYSSKDEVFAQRIHADLQSKGVRCWFAPHDMPIGGKILDEIDKAIRLRDKVLLILSEHSINSDWVEDEVNTALEEERRRDQTVLFPVRLDEAVMETDEAWAAKLRASRNIGDFRHWKNHDRYVKSLKRVLRDLQAQPKA